MKKVKIMSKSTPAYITDFGKVLKGKAFQDKAYLYSVSVPAAIKKEFTQSAGLVPSKGGYYSKSKYLFITEYAICSDFKIF